MSKAKAEQFIDYVQNALILGRRTLAGVAPTTMVWSLLHELEQASRAAIYIPEDVTAEEAAREFVRFVTDPEQPSTDFESTPSWLREFLLAELRNATEVGEALGELR